MLQTIPQGTNINHTFGPFTFGYVGLDNDFVNEYTNEQLLLMHLRDTACGGNASELARKIGKDSTYVSRLLYPIGKKARKSIGLEIMQACTRAFGLKPGFWERPVEALTAYMPGVQTLHTNRFDISDTVVAMPTSKTDRWTARALEIMSKLNDAQKAAIVVNMELYLSAVTLSNDGQNLQVAGKT